ncbi:MAG: S-layer homology domain-containing protein [Oscillospiraceae bacterium]|nr:S-layer homology domain-containing protein [Oscillospiraceae bacterium]
MGEAAAAGEIYEPVYRYNAVLLDGCDGKSNFNAELFYAGSPNDKYLRTTMLVRGKNVPCFSKDGYLLTGWEDSSGNLVAAGDNVVGTYPADEDGVITLYARWSKADQLGNGVRLVIDGDDMTELLDRDDSFYGNGWRFYPKGNELRIYGDSYYGDAIAYDGNLDAWCSGEVATGQIEVNGELYVYAGSNDAALHVRTSGVSAIRASEVSLSDKSGMTACQITAEGEGVIGIDAPIIRINCANVTITGDPAVPTDATIVCGSGIDYKVSEDRRTLTTFAIENKITLDGNGGTFDGQKTVDVDYDVSNKLDLSQYAFTRKGYALIGWATDANGSKFVTEYDGVISSTSYDTLYAVWIKVPESYAIFHTLGYSGRLTETVDRVEARENNIFYSYDLSSGFVMPETTEGAAIWEDINTHNLYFSGEKFTPASGAWFDCNKRVVNSEENMHAILLDGNGGTYAYRTGGVTYEVNRQIADYNAAEGETVNYACRFTRPGYTLASYNSEPDGSGKEYALNKCVVTDDMAPIQILYAQWKKNGESIQYITIDGKQYDAAQDWRGNGWDYWYSDGGRISLLGYHGGSIESDVALRVSCSKGQNIITGCISAPELIVNLSGNQNSGSVSLAVNAKEGAALISQGDMQINVQNLAELSVVGAEGYPAVSAGGELALNLYDEGRISARGGNTAAISAVSIIMSSRRGYLITAGSDPDNAVEVDSYSGQQYVSYEVRTKTLTLHGNGGTAGGKDSISIGTKNGDIDLGQYANSFSNDGKVLLGWSKSADATEIDYAAQSSKNFLFDDDSFAEDLYAVWESGSRKGVVLNDYGQRDDTVSPFDIRSYVYHERFVGAVDAGTQYTLPDSYKAGYRFLGWRSAQDGQLSPAGTEITVEQSVTYTAEYEVLSMTINGKTYRMDRAHGSRSLGWKYEPNRFSNWVKLFLYEENYSGGPISIPCNVELMAAGKITGTAGQPAVSVDGSVLIEGFRYRDDSSLTITGGAGAPAVRASGRIYAFPSAVPITFWGGDGQPALVGRSVQTGCVMLAGSSESDAVLTGRYHGESFVRVSDELLTVTVQPGQTVPALPEADGVVFVAWRADGRGSVWYRPGDVIEGEEVTLHANYMWDDSGAVILDGNGGTTSSGSKYYVAQVSGADLRLTESTARNGFTRDGYTLSGYNDRADGSGRNYTFRQLADGSAWDSLVGKVLTFFAQWTRNGDPVTPEKPSKPTTPTQPTTPPQTTTPDGSADITVSGSTVKVENVDVDKLVTDNGDKKTAEIDLSGTKSGITDVTLPTDAVKEVAASEAESLTVKLPDVTVSFDDKALAAVAEQSSGADLSLSVNVGSANNSNLTDAQKNAITGARELSVIEVSLSSKGEKISNFNGGSVTIDVPFQWSMKGLLRAYYIDDNGNKSAIDVTYKNGVATLVLNHFSTYVVEAVDALSFTDVSAKAYYFDAVAWAVKNKITSGQSDTLFAPDASCTRAQMVTFLWRANGSPEPTVTELPFIDVAADAYYAKAVLWAVENGITTGTSDTTFDPDGVVTRAEAVAFLWRAAGKPIAEGSLFADVESTKYYAEAVRWAVTSGITNGMSDSVFAPSSTCTRAQIVTFLYRDCMNK